MMKKLLLIAALAAVALGASADGYKIEKVWELNNPQQVTGLDRLEIRQGFGMDGKFYVNSKLNKVDTIDGVIIPTVPTIYEIDENGLTGVTFPGGTNCGITRDDAGNIVVSLAQFPNNWVEAGIRVINPATGDYVDYIIPEEAALIGRCDFLSFAKGNLMEDGEIWLTGATQGTGFSHIAIAGGEVDADNCYYMSGDGVTPTSSTVINPYTDINGDDVLLYVTRNDHPRKLSYNDDTYTSSLVTLPTGKSNTNGMFPFVWDGKELLIYSILNEANAHYMDGFAIAEPGAQAPIVSVPCVATTTNGFQGNWLNAEVDAKGVTIYQYFPGNAAGHFTVWRLTKEVPKVYMLGGDDQPWDCTNGTEFEYDAENSVYTATINFPAEFNYFGFTTELAENNDDGGWNYIEPFRFGAIADEGTDYWYTGEEDFISLTWDEYHAIRIPGGEYKLTVDLEAMKLFVESVVPQGKRGDANNDGNVSIADVSALIDYLLSKDPSTINMDNGDCNLDHSVTISDVSALIDFMLTGEWN